jgi:predicted nucleic acid-binding protein
VSLIISVTTPLNYLILIGQCDVLQWLFGRLLVPPAVIEEMLHPKAPAQVATWAANLPPWIEVRSPNVDLHLGIGAGEDAAISLAVELGDATLLMDDLKARAAARARGFITIGTITILDRADEAGLLDLETSISRLRATTFYLDETLAETVIARRAPVRTHNRSRRYFRRLKAAGHPY